MQAITRFSANGNSFDIPDADTPSFLKDAPDAQRVRRFTAGENTFDIPAQEADAFLKDAPDAVETRTLRYRANDGTDQTVDVPLKDMSRFLRAYNTDETYAADREFGRAKAESAAQKNENDGLVWSVVKGFGEGLLRSVTDSENLWRETYGDGVVATALQGANANANKIVNGILGLGADLESAASLATGGKTTMVGNWLADRAAGDRATLERTFPSQVGEAVGYEDWSTKAADWAGNTSATIIKFAAGDKDPTKLFNTGVVATAASDSYAQTYDNAIAHGKSVDEANYIATGAGVWNALMTMFLMKAFKGEKAAVESQLGKTVKDVVKREARTATQTGVTMGSQAAGNAAIEANAEGRRADPKELAVSLAKGFAEGVGFHAYSAFGAQVSEYGRNAEARKEWVDNFQEHILNSNADREVYLRTPLGDAVRGICESVQDGKLPDRKAFVMAGIPKELCKTEAQRREIATKFMETMQLSADARTAEAARRVYDLTDNLWLDAGQKRRDELASNTVPKDVRLWNGKKVVAERVDMGDGKFGYDFYHDAGDGTRQLITTSDEPLLRDAYRDANGDMMEYFGLERPKREGVEEPLLREQLEAEAKKPETTKPEEATNENTEANPDKPEVAPERPAAVPEAVEADGRDERLARGDQRDPAPRSEAPAVTEEQTAETPQERAKRVVDDYYGPDDPKAKPEDVLDPLKMSDEDATRLADAVEDMRKAEQDHAQGLDADAETDVLSEKTDAAQLVIDELAAKYKPTKKKQPAALAQANAEAKTADARRAAQMETSALEDEIATLEGLGKLPKKRQRQLDAYKAELDKRKAAEERPNLDDTPDEFDDSNDPLAKPIEERTKPDPISPASSPSAFPPKPALTPVAAAKLLGADAYNKAALQAKLKQWNAHPTDANAPHRAAANLMLEKLEGPKAEPETPAPVQSRTPSRAAESKPAPTATQLNELSNLYDAMKAAQEKVAKMRPGKRRDRAADKGGDAMFAFEEKYREVYGTFPPDKFYEMPKEELLGIKPEDDAASTLKAASEKLDTANSAVDAAKTPAEALSAIDQLTAKPAPASVKRRPGKKATNAPTAEPKNDKFDYGAAQKTVIDYFKATPEERATMPIAETLKAIKANDDVTLRHGIHNAINEMINGVDIGKKFDQAEYDQFIRYAKTVVGERVELSPYAKNLAVEHSLRPRTKASPEARRVNREKAWLLRDIDDTLSMSLGDKSGIIKQYDADIAKAKADGNKKLAESLASLEMAELDGIRLGKNGVVIKVPNSNATYTVRTAGQLVRLREKIEKEYGKNTGRVYYDRTTTERDSAKLEDPAFREWSQKRGTNADDAEALQRDRIAYDLDRAEQAAKRTGNWLGLKVVRETDPKVPFGESLKYLKGEGGKTVGWYDPRTKEVHLLPGADEKTVSHELGWHATYDWALRNNPTLARTMEQYAANAPEALKAEIRKLYGRDLTPAELIEEIGAGRFEREHGVKLQKLLADRANRAWYTKVWDGIKDAYKTVLTKLGFNRVNLDEALKDKTPEQAMEFLASAMAKGKALGKLRPGKGTDRAPMEARIPAPAPTGKGYYIDPNEKLGGFYIGVKDIGIGVGAGEKWSQTYKDADVALRVADERTGRYAHGDHTEDSLHLAKRLLPGLRQAAMDRRDRYEGDLAKIMRQHDITIGDIDDYLLSVAVPERNARLTAQGITDGAGMTDAEAAQLAADLRTKLGDARFNQVKRCANILWAMQKEGMQARIKSGRIAQDVFYGWQANEPHHIPMRTDFSEITGTDADNYSTGGYKRNDFKAAKGRRDRASSPTAFIFDEYTDARLSSLDNDLRVKLADFVRQNPMIGKISSANRGDNGFVTLGDQSGMGLKVTPKREQYGKKPREGEDPNLILFKEGGQLKAIELEGDFGTEIADSITNRMIYDFAGVGPKFSLYKISMKDASGRFRPSIQKTQEHAAGDWLKMASSVYASTATKWSPTFMLRNFVKDQIELNLQNIGEYGLAGGAKSAAKQFKGAFDAVAPISHYIKTKKFDTSTEMGRYFKRYVEAGGQIGGAANEGYAEIVRRFDKYHLATKKGKAKMLVDWLVRANEISEMMNRVANFKNACESGMSDRQAALKARDDSVDFNNFGRAKWMNAVYNFSNSVTGGTLRQAFYLTRKHGWKLAASLFAYGFMEGIAEVLMNLDDDARAEEGLPSEETMSEYQRANSTYVRRGGKFYRLPIHAGIFSTIKYAGNGAARLAFGKLRWEEFADGLLGEVRDTAKHFTGTGDVAGGDSTIGTLNIGDRGGKLHPLPNIKQSFAPSVAQGLIQLTDYGPNAPKEAGTGLTFAGTPLRDRSFNAYEPQAFNGRKSTPIVYHKVAQALNAMSGGNEHRKGNYDMAPEDLKVITEALGKNALKDAANAISLLMTPFDKDARAEWRINKTPFVGDFVRDVPENDTLYYKEMDRFAADKNEYAHLEGKEKQAFAEDHRLVKRMLVATGKSGNRKSSEEKSEAERLTDEIKKMRNLEKSDKTIVQTSAGTPGNRHTVRNPVAHEYTPEEREAAERARRKKQARFIRLSHEEDERRAR